LAIPGEQRLVYIQMRKLGCGRWELEVMWVIFQESGPSPIVMRVLKKLDNPSDRMQQDILKNLDGMSLGELLDFVLGF